uniref:7TM GPCR serpentine receptor class x (Srx) domain-containing protein n=1 Tax=Strongyloides stercoralis TaxID=6248 RepID=A0A0K0E438_STRER
MVNPLFFSKIYNHYKCNADEINHSMELLNEKPDAMGYVFLILGIIFIVTYLPCIFIMCHRVFLRNSCYKIMLLLSIIDVCAVMINSIATGLFIILRIPYCYAPKLHIIIGSLGISFWCSTCATACILAFNRYLDISHNHLFQKLFDGKKTFIWLALPIVYFFYFFFFTNPIILSIKYMSWFFDPFQDYLTLPNHKITVDFNSIPHTVNNILIIIMLLLNYGTMIYQLSRRAKAKRAKAKSTSTDTITVLVKVQIQVFIICFFIFSAAFLHVYVQFFYVPPIFSILSQILWSISQGCGGIIYITLNKTIRNALMNIFSNKKIFVLTIETSKKVKNVSKKRFATNKS